MLDSPGAAHDALSGGASNSGGAGHTGKKKVTFSPSLNDGGAAAQHSTPPELSGGDVPESSAPEDISMDAGELSPYSLFDLTILNEVQELVGTFNHELFATSASHACVQYWPSLKVANKHTWKGKSFFANCFHLGSKVDSIITKCLRD
jgi:hypothetical protein